MPQPTRADATNNTAKNKAVRDNSRFFKKDPLQQTPTPLRIKDGVIRKFDSSLIWGSFHLLRIEQRTLANGFCFCGPKEGWYAKKCYSGVVSCKFNI